MPNPKTLLRLERAISMCCALNPRYDQDEPYTAEELADFPRMGFGDDLDEVLYLSDAERDRLLRDVVACITPRRGTEAATEEGE